MNELSWLLYAAGAFDNLRGAIGLPLVFGSIGYGIYAVAWCVTTYDDDFTSPGKFRRWPIPVIVFLGLLAALMPSAQTIYMIAASEAGQRIAETPQAQEIGTKILRKLDDVLSAKKAD